MITIDTTKQTLFLEEQGKIIKRFNISTALNGLGEQENSGCTPRGWHEIKQKIGTGAPLNTVFVSREPTGEIYNAALKARSPDRDWILTRILWLSGLEEGRNLGNGVDTFSRYIYIHGTPYEEELGKAVSKGCVRMANNELIEFFDLVEIGTKVYIF
jgi:lipoprotein-anchoring transpeptidase ErfK/SrfK